MKTIKGYLLSALVAIAFTAAAQEPQILNLDRNSVLTWTNASLCVTCRVEWASAVEGPWHSDWDSLQDIIVTTNVLQRPVPRFFRIACSPARDQLVTTISGAAALTMITNRFEDPHFVVLDVRTPSEYASQHVRGALNLNLFEPTFQAELANLSRCDTYIVHCASGHRSGQAVQAMRNLGFFEVYDLGGLSNLTAVPGSEPWLEP